MVRFVWLLGVFRWVIPVEQCNSPVMVFGGHCSRWGSWSLGLMTFRRLNSFEVSKAEPWFYDDRTMFCCCHLQFQESDRALTPPMWSSVRPFQSWNTTHLPLDRKDGAQWIEAEALVWPWCGSKLLGRGFREAILPWNVVIYWCPWANHMKEGFCEVSIWIGNSKWSWSWKWDCRAMTRVGVTCLGLLSVSIVVGVKRQASSFLFLLTRTVVSFAFEI